MKFFIIAVAFAVVAVATAAITPEDKQKAEQYVKDCIAQSGLTQEAADKLRQGEPSDHSPESKAFGKCFYQKVGLINEQGEFNEAVAIEKFSKVLGSKEKAQEYISECKLKEAAKDEIANSLFKCYSTHKSEFAAQN